MVGKWNVCRRRRQRLGQRNAARKGGRPRCDAVRKGRVRIQDSRLWRQPAKAATTKAAKEERKRVCSNTVANICLIAIIISLPPPSRYESAGVPSSNTLILCLHALSAYDRARVSMQRNLCMSCVLCERNVHHVWHMLCDSRLPYPSTRAYPRKSNGFKKNYAQSLRLYRQGAFQDIAG